MSIDQALFAIQNLHYIEKSVQKHILLMKK